MPVALPPARAGRLSGDTFLGMDWRNVITIEPGKCGGKPCIRRMRITVFDVLDYLGGGMSVDEILDEFPYLTREDIQAACCFASEFGREQWPRREDRVS